MSARALRWAAKVAAAGRLPSRHVCLIWALAWHHTEAEGCFPSQETLSAMGAGPRQKISAKLRDLEELGLIWRDTAREGGRFRKTRYELFGWFSPCHPGVARHRATKKGHGGTQPTVPPRGGNIGVIDNLGHGAAGNVVNFAEKKSASFDPPAPPRRSAENP